MGYGAGLLGLIAIKVLAPGFYARQDIRTPVRIAVGVLVLTQLLNIALVPLFNHAGLALAIGIGAMVNALFLLVGPDPARRLPAFAGMAEVPAAGAGRQRTAGRAAHVALVALRLDRFRGAGAAARRPAGAVGAGAVVVYFGALVLSGLSLRQFVRK